MVPFDNTGRRAVAEAIATRDRWPDTGKDMTLDSWRIDPGGVENPEAGGE